MVSIIFFSKTNLNDERIFLESTDTWIRLVAVVANRLNLT